MLRPIFAIARATLGEAIRRKVLLIILFISLLFLIIAPSLGVLSARQQDVVLRGMMLGIIQLSSAVIAITLTVYMLPNEVERRTIYTILSKPVQRWQFLVGKYFGAVSALGVMMGLMGGVMVVTFAIQGKLGAGIELVRGVGMYFVQMSLLASVAICLSTFVPPLVNFFLSGGVFLLGSLMNPFFDGLQKSTNSPPMIKSLAQVVNLVLPNFANFNIQNPLVNTGQTIINEKTYYINAILYGLVYISAMLLGGMLVFDRREV